MAAFNVTLDDSSPLITYTPSNAWHDTPANDTVAKLYSRSSLHTSSTSGAAAELAFDGTGVWLYGGFRPSYGSYVVSIDGAQILHANATAPDLELRSLLAGVSGLNMGQHTVTLTSDGTGPIDLDYAIFETNVGTSGASLTNITIDDTNSQMQYSPSASDWQQDSSSMFYNDSLHYSQTTGAQASLSFSGDAIAVYGTVSPLHANYTASLDGVISQEFNASDVRILHTQTLLYFAQNLSSSDHKLVITGLGANGTGQYVDIDFISIYSAANDSTATATHESGSSVGSATSGSSTTGAPSSVGGTTNPSLNSAADNVGARLSDSSRLSKGAVAGIVTGTLCGLLLLLLILFFCFLKRRRGHSQSGSHSENPSPVLPMQEPDLEAARQFEIGDEDLHVADKEFDEREKRMTGATFESTWSQGSYRSSTTLPHTEPPLPKWDTSAPVPTLMLASRDSTHTRSVSDSSTMVADEVARGLSEVVLSPPSRTSKGAAVRPPRPPSLAMSVTRYYFEA